VITYRRIQHAAHYEAPGQGAKGHDLEQWDALDAGQIKRGRSGDPVVPDGVPADAEYHCGYIDRDGRQHWLYTRRSPMTGTCERCQDDAGFQWTRNLASEPH
jgi:hypothetical protein